MNPPPLYFQFFPGSTQEALEKIRKWGAAGAASEKMVAPQAPLVKNGGAEGAIECNAAPQALLGCDCAQMNTM